MARNFEMSRQDSDAYVRELMKNPKPLKNRDFRPGTLLFYRYDAKDKTQTYDNTPLVLVLGQNGRYMLGLNFHWLPYQKRLWLVDRILKHSKQEVQRNSRLRFTYEDFKPLMRSVHFQPCIRLYIKRRISRNGVIIPPSELVNATKLKAETFTNGRYSQAQLYQMARMRGMRK